MRIKTLTSQLRIHKIVPKYVIRRQLDALRKTLEEYNNKNHYPEMSSCQLCITAISSNTRRKDNSRRSEKLFKTITEAFNSFCPCCPWVWIINKPCIQRYKSISVLDQTKWGDPSLIEDKIKKIKEDKNKKIIEDRMKEIKQWIKMIEDYLK